MDKCFECGEPAQANHHVVPKILGGTKTIPLCDDCHSKVHDKDLTSMRKLTTDLFKSWGPPKVGRRHKGGIPPYGFDVQKTHGQRGGTLVENEEEQKVVKQIKKWRDAGLPKAKIMRELNEKKIPTKTGKSEWKYTATRRIVYFIEHGEVAKQW